MYFFDPAFEAAEIVVVGAVKEKTFVYFTGKFSQRGGGGGFLALGAGLRFDFLVTIDAAGAEDLFAVVAGDWVTGYEITDWAEKVVIHLAAEKSRVQTIHYEFYTAICFHWNLCIYYKFVLRCNF